MSTSLVGGVLTPLDEVGELGPTEDVSAWTSRPLVCGVFGCKGDESTAIFLGFDASDFVLDVALSSRLLVAGVFGFGAVLELVAGVFAPKNDIKLFCLSDSVDALGLGGILGNF